MIRELFRKLSKFLFGIFLTNEDIPYTASDFRDKINASKFRTVLLILVATFWLFLFYILYISFRFFSTPDTLYHVTASTETVTVLPYENASFMPFPIDQAVHYPGCTEETNVISGSITIFDHTQIHFDRIGSGELWVTLSSESLAPVGVFKSQTGEIKNLSDCEALKLPVDSNTQYTLAVDGVISIGGELKEGSIRDPILHSGKVTISDKGAVSDQYYQSETFNLERGDKFSIRHPSVQSSGFIYVNSSPSIQVIYNGKGEAGVIQRYKSEDVTLKNTIWTKLSHDESIIFLWLFLVGAFSLLKFVIRVNIE